MSHEVTITVSGDVGTGKSALLGEIEIMCKALNIPVRYADEKRAQADKNMNHADWTSELEMYKPSVVLVEDMPWLRAAPVPQVAPEQASVRAQALQEAASAFDETSPFIITEKNAQDRIRALISKEA